jgi:hypothetical protein
VEHKGVFCADLKEGMWLLVPINVGVALVIHDEDVVLQAQGMDALEIRQVHQGSRRIVGGVEPQKAAGTEDFSGQLPRPVFEVSTQGLRVGDSSRKERSASVAGVTGVGEHNRSIVCGRVNHQQRHVKNGFFGPGGRKNLCGGIQINLESTLHVARYSLSKGHFSPHSGILADLWDGLANGLANERRCGFTRIACSKIIEGCARSTYFSLALVERNLRVSGEVIHEGVLSQVRLSKSGN